MLTSAVDNSGYRRDLSHREKNVCYSRLFPTKLDYRRNQIKYLFTQASITEMTTRKKNLIKRGVP